MSSKRVILSDEAVTVEVVKVGRKTYFTALAPWSLPDLLAREAQTLCGFDPAGYGGPHGITELEAGSKSLTSWWCYSSAD